MIWWSMILLAWTMVQIRLIGEKKYKIELQKVEI